MAKLTFAQRKKAVPLMEGVPKDARILEVGCAGGWLAEWLREQGWTNYTGMDLAPPAPIVGDIRDWKRLGLQAGSFDAIVALEVVEHVVAYQEFYDLLKPGGLLLVSSPVPHMDWLCKLLEAAGINQKRTSPHDYLIDFRKIPLFRPERIWTLYGIVQLGRFRKAQ